MKVTLAHELEQKMMVLKGKKIHGSQSIFSTSAHCGLKLENNWLNVCTGRIENKQNLKTKWQIYEFCS